VLYFASASLHVMQTGHIFSIVFTVLSILTTMLCGVVLLIYYSQLIIFLLQLYPIFDLMYSAR